MAWQGIGGELNTYLLGGPKASIPSSGAFDPGSVGAAWRKNLLGLYSTPADQTPWYKSAAGALRGSIDQEGAAANEQLGQAMNAGGTYDSGARIASLQNINRAKIQSYSQGIASIIQQIEQAKLGAAAPFLSARIADYGAKQNAEAAARNEWNFRYGKAVDFTSSFLGGGGGGGMGGGMGMI